jgi:hypothetical protein
VEDFIYYDEVLNKWGRAEDWQHALNEDSIFNVFFSSLNNLNLSIANKSKSINGFDNRFKRDFKKSLDKNLLAEMKDRINDPQKTVLIPIIKLSNYIGSGMYFTGSGSVGGSRFLMQNILYLDIYIVKENEVLYNRSGVFFGRSYPAYDVMDIQHTLTEQDWDELVALVMKDYIDRIRE